MFDNPRERKLVRMNMWLDQVLKNIADIEEAVNKEEIDFSRARQEIRDQYRLIKIMKNVLDGKTVLEGWKTGGPE
jgi:cell division protein FtsL